MCPFFFRRNVSELIFSFQKQRQLTISSGRGLASVLMLSKCGKGSVGGGESGQKTKTTPDTGGKSVSEKSQDTHTCRNPFKKSKSQQLVVMILDRCRRRCMTIN